MDISLPINKVIIGKGLSVLLKTTFDDAVPLARWQGQTEMQIRKLLFQQVSSTEGKVKVKVLVAQSCLSILTPWTVAHQALLSVEFSRQEYWSGLPFPSLEDLPDSGIDCLSHQGSPNFYLKRETGNSTNFICFQ